MKVTKFIEYDILRDLDRTRHDDSINNETRDRKHVLTRAQVVEVNKILEKLTIDDVFMF